MAKVNTHGLKIKGLKSTAGATQHTSLGHLHFGAHISVFYNTQDGELLRHYHHNSGEFTTYKDSDVIHVANYGGPVTMQQIADDVKRAVANKKRPTDWEYGAEW